MKNLVLFSFKCALVGGLVMMLSMIAGEKIAGPDLFHGFSTQPLLWIFCLIESAVWLAPLVFLGAYLLKRSRIQSHAAFLFFSSLLWTTLGGLIVFAYKMYYFPEREWALKDYGPEVTYGWALPCLIILVLFVVFSRELQTRSLPN